jgi:hypothetical protein
MDSVASKEGGTNWWFSLLGVNFVPRGQLLPWGPTSPLGARLKTGVSVAKSWLQISSNRDCMQKRIPPKSGARVLIRGSVWHVCTYLPGYQVLNGIVLYPFRTLVKFMTGCKIWCKFMKLPTQFAFRNRHHLAKKYQYQVFSSVGPTNLGLYV